MVAAPRVAPKSEARFEHARVARSLDRVRPIAGRFPPLSLTPDPFSATPG